jgi:hypothetical protein
LEEVKVKLAGLTLDSPVSFEVSVIVTSAVGWVSNTTVKVALVPDSDTVRLVCEVVIPSVSLSVVVTDTVGGVRLL